MPAIPGFLPSATAPLFANDGAAGPWPAGTSLTISISGLPAVSLDATRFGLCGGMSFLARDIFQAGTPQLRGRDCTKIPVALADYLVTRLGQSFDGPGIVATWLLLTQLPDHDTHFITDQPGVFHITVDECTAIMADIDSGVLSPIGVICTGPSYWPADVFLNHVELVYGYDLAGSQLTLRVYDCNHPGKDTLTISLDISSPTPAKVISTNGTDDPDRPGQVRGFFHLPYTFASPAPAYIDDATVVSNWSRDQMTPGAKDTATVFAVNTGSTSWTPAGDYRLGSQAPPDNTTWGTARVDLPAARVDPQQQAVFSFPVVAPAAEGRYSFSWQMVRDPDSFFGTGMLPPEMITVAPAGTPVVPDVLSMDRATAEQVISAAGLKFSVTQTAAVDSGTVIKQSPAGGTISTAGATVHIWLAGTNR
jgi:hypothetical protein